MEQARSFDRIAGLYRQARRGYPAALFDDLAERAGLGPDCQVLEVGCGTGQATVDLAARAHSVLAIDPGAQLIAEARAQTRPGTRAGTQLPSGSSSAAARAAAAAAWG